MTVHCKGAKRNGVLEHLVEIIMSCLQGSKLTALINEQGAGFLKPTRGLRQGCPLSPYLFIIAMKFLTKDLRRASNRGAYKEFNWHM
jgi:Reverse transcriptase (RNA-dependent DNA polymerase)